MSSTVRASAAYCPFILKETSSQFVETFNALRTAIQFASAKRQMKRLLITSAQPLEGKSTVAVNLAASLASAGSHVLLMDCDLRTPAIHRYLGLKENALGLTSILAKSKKPENCLTHLSQINIDILPSGPMTHCPAELLCSGQMASLMQLFSSRYDYILLDTPPVLPVTDAVVASRYSDGVIFVIRERRTKIVSAQLAKKSLESVGATVIGTVLTCFN